MSDEAAATGDDENLLDLYYEFRGDFEEVHSAEWQDSSQRNNTRSEIT